MSTAKVPAPRSVIVQTLSQRLYSSLASALREVVTNAADASAELLQMTLYCSPTPSGPQHNLVFFDDGNGMQFDPAAPDASDFANYLTLGGRSRRERENTDETDQGRPLIGLMGVGSLAVAPWCECIRVLTKTKQMDRALNARVEYGKFFSDRSVQRRPITDEYQYDYDMIDVLPEDRERSFTVIEMVNLRRDVVETLLQPPLSQPKGGSATSDSSDLGMFRGGYAKVTGPTPRRGRITFKQYSGIVRFMHELALMVPVAYPPNAPTNDPERKALAEEVKGSTIEVRVQGVELHRPMPVLGKGI